MLEYPSVDEFYLEDSRRFHSPEADYGVMWRGGAVDWPMFRISYLRTTGEVAAFEQGTGKWARVRVLGVVEPDAEGCYYSTLDEILCGWADPSLNGNFSLSWVEAQLSKASAR